MKGDRPQDHVQWRKLRPVIYQRDRGICQLCGDPVPAKGYHIDHIVDWRDGGAWFDPTNLRLTHARCNIARRNATLAGKGRVQTTLVVGPPGAGKSTYVEQHRDDGDLVIDFDLIAQALGSSHSHDHSDIHLRAAKAARNAVLSKLRRGELGHGTAWIISSNPKATTIFPFDEVVKVGATSGAARRAEQLERPASAVAVAEEWDRGQVSRRPW